MEQALASTSSNESGENTETRAKPECNLINSISFPQSLSRQSSLAEDRINSSDEDEFLEERSGGTYEVSHQHSLAVRPNSFPQARACKLSTLSSEHSTSSTLNTVNNQPDLIKELLALKTSQTENDLKRLEMEIPPPFQSSSFDVPSNENLSNFLCKKHLRNQKKSESFTTKTHEALKKKRKKDLLSKSCISQ